MKKIIVGTLAAAALFLFAACGNPSQVNQTVADITQKIEGMTVEKASGIYELSALSLGTVAGEDYEYNTLTLESDGTFAFAASCDGKTEQANGIYRVADNGALTLSDGVYLAAKDEKLACDGTQVVVSGTFGQQKINLVYQKQTKKEN